MCSIKNKSTHYISCFSYSGTPSELVCASNMQTYASECEMQRASCDRLASNPHYETLTVIFYGDCAEREVAALGNPPTLSMLITFLCINIE